MKKHEKGRINTEKMNLIEEEKPGPIKKFLGQFKDFLIILLIVAAIAAAVNRGHNRCSCHTYRGIF